MSHFAVAVFSHTGTEEEIAMLLEPYSEDVDETSPYAEFVEDDDYEEDEYGRRGYYTNPNAKWDWWVIGGRWSDMLRLNLKNGERADTALASDVSTDRDESKYGHFKRFWEINVDKQAPSKEEMESGRYLSFYSPTYYMELYGTKEHFANVMSKLNVFAVVDTDGDWIEQGEMGWFGFSSVTKESIDEFRTAFERQLAEAAEKGMYVTIVDCHI